MLLFGPVGAGKSCFINSVCSIFGDRKVTAVQIGTAAESYSTTFDPNIAIPSDSKHYIKEPTSADKVCCVVFVVKAPSLMEPSPITESKHAKDRITEILKEIQERELGRILVITHIDEVSSDVYDDVKLVYQSKTLKDIAERGSSLFQLPLQNVHLVQNYWKVFPMKPETSLLLLTALQDAVQSTADYLSHKQYEAIE